MSMKNRVLLHRTGRDQFGNSGDSEIPKYVPSPETERRFVEMQEKHAFLNDRFVDKYRDEWLNLFSGKSKKDIWKILHPYGKPSLGTFYNLAKIHGAVEDFLAYWLVANKQVALKRLGYDRISVKNEISKFSECGRYFVTYGRGRAFSTSVYT